MVSFYLLFTKLLIYVQMELSRYLRQHSRTIEGKSQLFINAYAKALEVGSMYIFVQHGSLHFFIKTINLVIWE